MEVVKERLEALENELQCNCDLDNWEPEWTGHSWVCRIHKAYIKWLVRGKSDKVGKSEDGL